MRAKLRGSIQKLGTQASLHCLLLCKSLCKSASEGQTSISTRSMSENPFLKKWHPKIFKQEWNPFLWSCETASEPRKQGETYWATSRNHEVKELFSKRVNRDIGGLRKSTIRVAKLVVKRANFRVSELSFSPFPQTNGAANWAGPSSWFPSARWCGHSQGAKIEALFLSDTWLRKSWVICNRSKTDPLASKYFSGQPKMQLRETTPGGCKKQ